MASKQIATAPAAQVTTRGTGLMARMATRFGVDPDKLKTTLAATVFKNATDEQLMALLVVAEKYNLNPWLKEIYAFPAKGGGIVPIVGIDGWIRLINSSPELDSTAFTYGPEDNEGRLEWIECTIVLKNRALPITIREYYRENYRKTEPWDQMPNRMLRHRALIQCGRVALGYVGIYEPDEADRFEMAKDVTPPRDTGKPITQEPKAKKEPLISVDQITVILDKCRAEGIDLDEILARFLIPVIEDLPASKFDEAIAALDELSAK